MIDEALSLLIAAPPPRPDHFASLLTHLGVEGRLGRGERGTEEEALPSRIIRHDTGSMKAV